MKNTKFIAEKHTLVFYGICGSGKTMLSIALGIKACMQGYKVKFITLSQLGYHSQKYIGTKARS